MRKTLYFYLIISLGCALSWIPQVNADGHTDSEVEKDDEIVQLSEITVTATRAVKSPYETPNAITVLDQKQFERTNAEHASNLLQNVVGVIAQETTVGQGSPMLRSLTGYQTVIQVDWVRLNNSTFRSGPNQYTATIAPEIIEKAEVLLGSSSVLYGSGAMGGVVSFFTKDIPLDVSQEAWTIHPRVLARYSTATQERLGRLEVTGNSRQFGFSIGGGLRYYGDINSGNGYDLHYYKNRKYEIVSEMPRNTELYTYNDLRKISKDNIPETWLIDDEGPLNWQAYDADAKIAYQLNDTSTINVAYQMWRQPQTPRYDKIAPQEFDEFYFEPQNRDLVYATYLANPENDSIDQYRVTASFHRQEEGRNEVQRDADSRRHRNDTVNTIGLSAQVVSSVLPKQRIVGGGEFYFDTLQSQTERTDAEGNITIDDNLARFIDGSQFWDASLYLQDEITLHDKVELTLGGRATVYQTHADLSIRAKDFDVFNELDSSLTGSAGIVIGLTNSVNFVSNIATAFRAPSLNDTTAVEVTNEGVTAPSPDLNPETSWTVEGGFKVDHTNFRGTLTVFHSRVNGLVARRPVQEVYDDGKIPQLHQALIDEYDGIDVLVFDNVDKVQFQGVEIAGLVPIDSTISIFGNAAFMHGEVLLINGVEPDPEKPWEAHTRREPPLNGIIGIQWNPVNTNYWGTLFIRGAAEQRRLNRSDIRDPRIQGKTRDPAEVEFDDDGNAVDAGTPAWWTLNLQGGVKLFGYSSLTITLENLWDRRYRVHGSGVNSPGFNVSISLDNRF